MNTVIVSGNITRDLICRTSQNGTSIARFSVASNKKVGDKEIASFVDVTAFGSIAEACGNNLHKGSPVIVLGEYNTRSYVGSDGQKKYSTTVVAREVAVKLIGERSSGFGSSDRDSSGFSKFGPASADNEDIPF